MLCPYCQTENRDDREECYYCQKDLSMLRLIVNKAKHHYNQGLEYAERNRPDEALRELSNAIELDASLANAHVVMGTIYAQREDFARASECWNRALALDHRFEKAHGYLAKLPQVQHAMPVLRQLRLLAGGFGLLMVVAVAALILSPKGGLSKDDKFKLAALDAAYDAKNGGEAAAKLIAMVQHSDAPKTARKTVADLAAKLNGGELPGADDQATTAAATPKPSEAAAKIALVEKTLKSGQAVEAAKALELLKGVKLSPAEAKQAAALRDEAEKAVIAQVQAEANAYFERKLDYETFHKTADNAITLFPSSKDLGVVTGLLDKAAKDNLDQNTKLSEAEVRTAWAWFEERDGKFEDERITKDEAQHAVDIHRRLLASMTQNRATLCYYTAVAYIKLGQKQEALGLLDKVLKDYPKSYVVKPATALRARLAGPEKAPEKPAATPTALLAPIKK